MAGVQDRGRDVESAVASVILPEDLGYPGLPEDRITLHWVALDSSGRTLGMPESLPALPGRALPFGKAELLLLQLEGRDWVTGGMRFDWSGGVTRMATPMWEAALTVSGRLQVPPELPQAIGSRIEVEGLPRIGWADSEGGFRLDGMPAGVRRIRVRGTGFTGVALWNPSASDAANLQIPVRPEEVPLLALSPAFSSPGDILSVAVDPRIQGGFTIRFTGAEAVAPRQVADGLWEVRVPEEAVSGPVRVVRDGVEGLGIFWHRMRALRLVGLPSVVPHEAIPQAQVEGEADDGYRAMLEDAAIVRTRRTEAGFERLDFAVTRGALVATASVLIDDARLRRLPVLPVGVTPYALSLAPDGGWLVGDHLGARCLHRSPEGLWQTLAWHVDRPRSIAVDSRGQVLVLGRTGPGADVLRSFQWSDGTSREVARGNIDAFAVRPDGLLIVSEAGRLRDEDGRTLLSLPPGSRAESVAVGRLGQVAVAGPGAIWLRSEGSSDWQVVDRRALAAPSGEVRAMAWLGESLLLAEVARARLWRWSPDAGFRQLAGEGQVTGIPLTPGEIPLPALAVHLGRPTSLIPLGDGRLLLADPLSGHLLEWLP